jgi:hypothetical protein
MNGAHTKNKYHKKMGLPIGLQNNNPGNIWNNPSVKYSNEIQPNISNWKKFPSMAWGYRALIKNLQAYINTGTDTITEITAKWAPQGHGSNNPEKYAVDVSNMVNVPQDSVIEANDIDTLMKISYAISQIEQGVKPNPNEIAEGAKLLGVTTATQQPKKNGNGKNVEREEFFKWVGAIALGALAIYGTIKVLKNEK